MRGKVYRGWLFLAALLAGSGVALAAVAAHTMMSPYAMMALERATTMQLLHAVALVALSTVHLRLAGLARLLLLVGTVIFSGAIYARYLLGLPALGSYAPVGGSILI